MRTFQNVRIIFENRQKQSKLNLVFILIFFFLLILIQIPFWTEADLKLTTLNYKFSLSFFWPNLGMSTLWLINTILDQWEVSMPWINGIYFNLFVFLFFFRSESAPAIGPRLWHERTTRIFHIRQHRNVTRQAKTERTSNTVSVLSFYVSAQLLLDSRG